MGNNGNKAQVTSNELNSSGTSTPIEIASPKKKFAVAPIDSPISSSPTTSQTVFDTNLNNSNSDIKSPRLIKEPKDDLPAHNILFLGLPGSGRGTVINKIKQHIQNTTGVSPALQYRELIQYHTLRSIQQILQAIDQLEALDSILQEISNDEEQKNQFASTMEEISKIGFTFGCTNFDTTMAQKIQYIWSHECIKQFVEKNREEESLRELLEIKTADYFLDNLIRIGEGSKYVPTQEDIDYYQLHFNNDSRGVEQISFIHSKQKFRIFNVEGQRNESRKWLHCFEGIDVVVFVVPIGDYDVVQSPTIEETRRQSLSPRTMPESLLSTNSTDTDSNMMRKSSSGNLIFKTIQNTYAKNNLVRESFELFARMCNSAWFMETPIILLFTKYDLFQEKIEETDLICCFEDYLGGAVEESAVSFLTQKFYSCRKGGSAEDIFVGFVAKDDSPAYLSNNLAGMLKNALVMKEEERQRKIQQQQQALLAQQQASKSSLGRAGSIFNKSMSSLRKERSNSVAALKTQ